MTQKQLYILFGALAVLVIAVAFFFLRPVTDGTTQASSDNPERILETDRTMGSPSAKVTLIEYGALTCPHCAHFNETVFPLVKENYIDTGKVFYVFRLFPINAADAWAEKIARCLPADNYFQFVDLLFRNQDKWGPEQNIGPDQQVDVNAVHQGLIQMARIAGMSAEKVDQCINDTKDDQRINKVAEDAIARYKIEGTPTLVVNGVSLGANVPSWEQLKKVLDDALAKK